MPSDVQREALRVDDLMREVERALWTGEDPRYLLRQLVELARLSAPGSEPWLVAHRQLAATAAETDPWRASLLARRVLAIAPDDPTALAALALAQSLLGNLRYAVRCYERALALQPNDIRSAHNLGHLYDAVFDQPERALPLLERAMHGFASTGSRALRAEVAASYAHALARVGRVDDAKRILETALARGRTREQAALHAWILRGAPVE